MVDIEYRPIKKIIVHEIIKYDLDKFTEMKSKNPGNVVHWADGIVMQRGNYASSSPKMSDEEMEGTVHWALVEFAAMPEYKKSITNDATGGTISVIDVSSNTAISDFVRWLKKHSPWAGSIKQ